MPANYYKVLQVDPLAEEEVIHASYRALAKKYSKDENHLQQLNLASEVLLDSDRRRTYDVGCKPKGKVVGNYKIIEKLAEGGFGTTYKAEHTTLGSLVCLKHAQNVSALDEQILLDEAKVIWDLRHWGIPAIRDILRMPDDSLSLVMSYVPGPTLAEVLEKNKPGIDPENVAWITERILNILRYLHMHGVIHGDIKPQNIIIQPENHTVTLVDYGLSLIKPTRKSESKGYTPYFAAPEQTSGKPLLQETDLYGLGMTMIFALGGDVARVKIPDYTPPEIEQLIKRMIRQSPIQRPPVWTVEDLCETIVEVRKKDFGRRSSAMKPLKF